MRNSWKKDINIVQLITDINIKLNIPISILAPLCKMSEKEMKHLLKTKEQPVFSKKMFMLTELEDYYHALHKELTGVQ